MAARTSTTRPQIALTNPKLAELLVVAGGFVGASVTAGKVALAVSSGADDRSLKTCTVGGVTVAAGFRKLEIVMRT